MTETLAEAGMVEDFPAVDPGEFLTKVRKLMREEEVHEFPVVDGGRVEGVIRQRGLMHVTSTKSNVTVKGFMEPAPEIPPDSDLYVAAGRMVEWDLDLAPVTDDGYGGSVRMGSVFRTLDGGALSGRVGDHMSGEVKCCSASDHVSRVWVNMMETGFTGYPVLKEGGLVGMITATDVIREGHARVKRESRTGDNVREGPEVERLMTTPVKTASPDEGMEEAFERMVANDVGRLPVLESGEVVGIVDRYDVIEAVLEEKDV